MVNGLGVLGWGVGGIEAEAAMLGQPVTMLNPQTVGMRLNGKLPAGATATDLVLTVTQMLRKLGVVGKFVEFFGPGLDHLALADRLTIANMAPEYGATCGLFPIDAETLNYLRLTGRPDAAVALVETYAKAQGFWRGQGAADATYSETLELDLANVVPSLAGPKRPQDRLPLAHAKRVYRDALAPMVEDRTGGGRVRVGDYELSDGAVVIAAITSCTNTSNPSVLLAAGLLAKKANERGLTRKPWVKTSLAPGSLVVTDYLKRAGLTPHLEALGFHTVGYGCTTCIGNSGPLPEEVSRGIRDESLVVCSVLSGNRNFEGRVHAEVKMNFLASPPLVVAYAIAGTLDIDLDRDALGADRNGAPVYLKDIWPGDAEVATALRAIDAQMFKTSYANVYAGDARWAGMQVPESSRYAWRGDSTYIRNPPYFVGMGRTAPGISPIEDARCLAVLGDSITTDHISPAGNIRKDSPAGKFLIANGVEPKDFNQYGARRGNHEVMMRGTFANIRLKNLMLAGVEGGFTRHVPSGEQMSIYDAAMRYAESRTPLVVLAGKEYGTGSSRDWAAKGTRLLGVRAVIAESFERIHRSNLVGMGVLPLTFEDGRNAGTLGLTGNERFSIEGLRRGAREIQVHATDDAGQTIARFTVNVRVDTPKEWDYYENGGILQYVLRTLAA
jgi:aconitate hydratase